MSRHFDDSRERSNNEFDEQLNKEKIKKQYCCEPNCNKDAEFNIHETGEGKTYEDYTHACAEHLPIMINENQIYEVRKINSDDY